MPDIRFRRTTTAVRAGLLGLAFLGAACAALAATAPVGLGVHLRITGSCQVDSTPVFDDGRAPRVACRGGTPHALRSRGEAAPLSVQRVPAADGRSVVVTLVF